MRGLLRKLARSDRGATALEYALIISLISMVMFGAFQALMNKTGGLYGTAGNKLGS